MKISDAKLAELEALRENAAPGKWEARGDNVFAGEFERWEATEFESDKGAEMSAQFIAAARNALPDLIADLREAEAERDRLREALEHIVWAFDNDDGTLEHDFRPDNALEKARCVVMNKSDAQHDDIPACEHARPFTCEPCWRAALGKAAALSPRGENEDR